MRHTNLAILAFIVTLLAILPGCKTPRSADYSLVIQLEPVPSPPIEVEQRWGYAMWWLWGWAPGIETIGRYQSDQYGRIMVPNIDRDHDWLVIDDSRYDSVDIAGRNDQPMAARSYNWQTNAEQMMAVASDGVITIQLQPREKK